VKLGDCEDKIFPRVDEPRFNQVEVLNYRRTTRYNIFAIVRN